MLKDSTKKNFLKNTLKKVSKKVSNRGIEGLTPLEVIKGRGIQRDQIQKQRAAGEKGLPLTDNLRGAVDKANILSGKPTNHNFPLIPRMIPMRSNMGINKPAFPVKPNMGINKPAFPVKPNMEINKPVSPVLSGEGAKRARQIKDALARSMNPKATTTPELKEKFVAPVKPKVRAIDSNPIRIK
jgi:hypothetical protein